MKRTLAAAVALLAALTLGWILGKGRETNPEANFALLLYGDSVFADSTTRAERLAELTRWKGDRSTATGDALMQSGGYLVFKADTNPFSGVVVEVISVPRSSDPVGVVLIKARNTQAALAIASDGPHAKYGGRIVVRPLVERGGGGG